MLVEPRACLWPAVLGAVTEGQQRLFAAECGALPGDALYGLKRTAESVDVSLSGSDLDKGHAQLVDAQKRVEEIDALLAEKEQPSLPDTGSLRGDLLGAFCGMGGITDPGRLATFSSVLTAVTRDPEFAEAFRTRVIGPKIALTQRIYERARDRGEIRDDVDLEILGPALAGTMMLPSHAR